MLEHKHDGSAYHRIGRHACCTCSRTRRCPPSQGRIDPLSGWYLCSQSVSHTHGALGMEAMDEQVSSTQQVCKHVRACVRACACVHVWGFKYGVDPSILVVSV